MLDSQQNKSQIQDLKNQVNRILANNSGKYKNMGDPNAKRIIAYRGDRSACWFYRLHSPLSYVVKNEPDKYFIHITSLLEKDQIGAFDLAILQRQYKQEVFNALMVMKQVGMKVVFEIDDDLFGVPKWNPAYRVYGKNTVRENLKYFLSNVDAIFVTNEYLKSVYSPYCKHIYVLPNSVDKSIMYPSPANSTKRVVCWQGSHTHKKDIKIITPALQQLNKDEDIMVKLWSYKINGIYQVPAVPFEAFYPMFSQLDGCIGLAPLTTVPFNKSKSNLKFLEYAAQGIVTIASDFGPYAETIQHEKTGILISDNREWYDWVRYLLENEDKRVEILKNAQTYVDENFDMSKNYVFWKLAIDEILRRI